MDTEPMTRTPGRGRTLRIGIAAGAAALLAAGGTTFSLWVAEDDLATAQSFTTGGLDLTAGAAGGWVDGAGAAMEPDTTIDPGDSFTFTQEVTPTITGDFAAELTVGDLGVTALLAAAGIDADDVETEQWAGEHDLVDDGPLVLDSGDSGVAIEIKLLFRLNDGVTDGMDVPIVIEDVPVQLTQATGV